MKLKNRVAIVTGAGRGIGAALAKGLAREGAALIVNYQRSAGAAEAVAAAITGAGGRAVAVQADVKDLSHHGRLIQAALDSYGRLDILVNNAGVEFREPFLEAKPETWDLTFGVNVKGAYFLAQRAAKAMIAAGNGGKILNISSVHDKTPHRNNSIYTLTKGTMKMMTKALALELAEHKINVNSLAPGAILTDINRKVLGDPARRRKVLDKIPLRRIGDVEDVVGGAILLVSAEADYITGVTVYVDGGLLLQP